MSERVCFTMCATTFSKSGDIDEDAMQAFVSRSIEANVGLYLGSGGNGEGLALSFDELHRLYRAGVLAGQGKVPIHSNLPDQHTAEGTIAHAKVAVGAGIEVVHMYTLAGWHGMVPNDAELTTFYDTVLKEIRHPVAVAVQPLMGYRGNPKVIADICNRHTQVVAVRLSGVDDTYFINLQDMITRDLAYYVQVPGSMSKLALGAHGLFASEGNILPATFKQYLDLFEAGKLTEAARVYADLRRFNQHVVKWGPAGARWLKMAMKVLKLPGGEGGLRAPYQMPPDEELATFAQGLLRLRIPELDALAAAAGLTVST